MSLADVSRKPMFSYKAFLVVVAVLVGRAASQVKIPPITLGPPVPTASQPTTPVTITSSSPPPATPTSSPPESTTYPGVSCWLTTVTFAPPPAETGTVPVWGQCGGKGFSGPSICASGLTCEYINDWYSQCQPAKTARTLTVCT
ncbi:unnamed protein product [Cyclocybe aegerita]|uniref:CBM1 domain-containing protein n=1 Tax=Cyclocybe aegerita TaxID=1973307 RepID=A0A8S0VU74_CYCAE|nr:unnamed protein product [Cyclocybe aegerita]